MDDLTEEQRRADRAKAKATREIAVREYILTQSRMTFQDPQRWGPPLKKLPNSVFVARRRRHSGIAASFSSSRCETEIHSVRSSAVTKTPRSPRARAVCALDG